MNIPTKSPNNRGPAKPVRNPAKNTKNADADLSDRLDDLGSQIQKKRNENNTQDEGSRSSTSRGIAQAFRLSSEFIAGIAVGAGFGYALDTLAGTSPWGMIVLLLLGFAAGVLNTMRSAGLIAQSNLHLRARTDKDRDK